MIFIIVLSFFSGDPSRYKPDQLKALSTKEQVVTAIKACEAEGYPSCSATIYKLDIKTLTLKKFEYRATKYDLVEVK
jgi:hypothetical protein